MKATRVIREVCNKLKIRCAEGAQYQSIAFFTKAEGVFLSARGSQAPGTENVTVDIRCGERNDEVANAIKAVLEKTKWVTSGNIEKRGAGYVIYYTETQTVGGDMLIRGGHRKEEAAGDYLCFTSLQAGSTISMMSALTTAPTLEISADSKNFSSWEFTTITVGDQTGEQTSVITLAENEKVWVRGKNPSGFMAWETGQLSIFIMSGQIKVSGDVNTLLTKSGGNVVLPAGCYAYLFSENDTYALTDISELKLPSTTLSMRCYEGMFSVCHSLTAINENLLPTTVVNAENALSNMLLYIGAASIPAKLQNIITGLGYVIDDVYTKYTTE